MGPGTAFLPVIADADVSNGAGRVVMCTGRVFYDLEAARSAGGLSDVAIVRVEELYPFPEAALRDALRPHPRAEIVWCQDEPENMGAWGYIGRRLEKVMGDLDRASCAVHYAGRPANPSPAPGFRVNYEREQRALIDRALGTGARATTDNRGTRR